MERNNLLSSELLSVALDIPQSSPEGVFSTLRKAIETIVKRDGIKKDSILPGEIEADVFKRAVDYIYDDVSEFYYWIFDPEDDFNRYQYLQVQPARSDNSEYMALRKVVKAVVEDNLEAMRGADEITPEQDVEGLSDKITDQLTAYILNWQDWFYERKIEDDIDAYYEYLAEHADIYTYDDYSDLTNNPGNNQYDDSWDTPIS